MEFGILIDAMIRAGTLGLLALGITIVFKILRFINFAHCDIGVLGAYIAYILKVDLGFNIVLSFLVSIVIIGFLGVVIYKVVFKPIEKASSLTKLITSIGLSMILMSIMLIFFGPTIKNYEKELSPSRQIFGLRVANEQIYVLLVVIVTMVLFHLLLSKTKIGKAMRATSNNLDLAEAAGIDTDRVISYVWFIGCASAGLGGIIAGVSMGLEPFMGFYKLLLPVVAVVIFGGIGNPYGAILGAVVLSLIESSLISINYAWILNLGGLVHVVRSIYMPVEYAPLVFFGALIVILLERPRGLLGGGD
jgi:branched-subunit amino acid ABC-type transport system permease component